MLKQTFGFNEFLPLQAEIVNRAGQHRDTLAIMPTGGGKSLCYQLPALLFDGLTVVVSPLIALMQDQVRQLEQPDLFERLRRRRRTLATRARVPAWSILFRDERIPRHADLCRQRSPDRSLSD